MLTLIDWSTVTIAIAAKNINKSRYIYHAAPVALQNERWTSHEVEPKESSEKTNHDA